MPQDGNREAIAMMMMVIAKNFAMVLALSWWFRSRCSFKSGDGGARDSAAILQ